MGCKFIIKNIKGGKSIEIPSFDLLSADNKKFQKFLKDSTTVEGLNNLKEFLNNETPLHYSTINSIVDKWDIAKDNLLDTINSAIEELGTLPNLETALFKYLKTEEDGKNVYGKKLKEIIKTLSVADNTVKFELFANLSKVSSSLASTSLSNELSDLRAEINESKTYFEPTFFQEEMKSFLDAVNKKLNWQNSKTLIKVKGNKLEGSYWNFENLTVYGEDPLQSNLFLALFNRIAGTINKDIMLPVIQNINTILKADKYAKYRLNENLTINEIFNGIYDSEKGIKTSDPEFDKLFNLLNSSSISDSVKINIIEAIGDIIDLVSYEIKNDKTENTIKSFSKTIQTLFTRIVPNTLGYEKIERKLMEEALLLDSVKKSTEKSLRESVEELDSLSRRRNNGEDRIGELYEISKSVTGTDLYQLAANNLIVGSDLVKMPFKKGGTIDSKSPYWVITGIYNNGKGKVKILGARLNQDGDFEKREHIFTPYTDETKKGDSITYKKRNPIIGQEYTSDEPSIIATKENSATILFDKGIPYEIARNILTKGDKNGEYLIVGVYPGFFKVQDQKGNVFNQYYLNPTKTYNDSKKSPIIMSKSVLDIITDETKTNFKNLVNIDIELVQEGDYFKDTKHDFFKKVMFVDEDNVWSWIVGKDGNYIIVPTPKSNISIVKASFLGDVNKNFVLDLKHEFDNLNKNDELNKIGKRYSKMASFQNSDIAKNGDLFVIETKKGLIFGKITNVEKNLAVVWDSRYSNINRINYLEQSENEKITFFSNDNKLSENFTFSLMANMWNVELKDITEGEPNPKEYKKVEYILPAESDQSKMDELFPGTLYTQVGRYIESDPKWIKDKDIKTDDILKLLNVTNKTHGLYVKTQTANELQRNYKNANLLKIEGFDNIDKKFLEEEGLFNGVYFSVYTKGNIDWDIYRVEKVDTSKGVVHARIYKINNFGKIVMNEKVFDIKTLVDGTIVDGKHIEGSIARYYIQNGNTNFTKITGAANKNKREEASNKKNQKQINDIKLKLEKAFEGLGIVILPSDENFQNGQKAKFGLTEDGIAYIKLNSNFGAKELVHEGLHVFLTALRYGYPEMYTKLIDSVKNTSKATSLLEKEELFMEAINNDSETGFTGDFLYTGKISDFIKALNASGEYLAGESTDQRKTVADILSQPISKFLNISNDNSHPLFNLNLAQMEPMFRRWMEENNVTLKCN